ARARAAGIAPVPGFVREALAAVPAAADRIRDCLDVLVRGRQGDGADRIRRTVAVRARLNEEAVADGAPVGKGSMQRVTTRTVELLVRRQVKDVDLGESAW